MPALCAWVSLRGGKLAPSLRFKICDFGLARSVVGLYDDNYFFNEKKEKNEEDISPSIQNFILESTKCDSDNDLIAFRPKKASSYNKLGNIGISLLKINNEKNVTVKMNECQDNLDGLIIEKQINQLNLRKNKSARGLRGLKVKKSFKTQLI